MRGRRVVSSHLQTIRLPLSWGGGAKEHVLNIMLGSLAH